MACSKDNKHSNIALNVTLAMNNVQFDSYGIHCIKYKQNQFMATQLVSNVLTITILW